MIHLNNFAIGDGPQKDSNYIMKITTALLLLALYTSSRSGMIAIWFNTENHKLSEISWGNNLSVHVRYSLSCHGDAAPCQFRRKREFLDQRSHTLLIRLLSTRQQLRTTCEGVRVCGCEGVRAAGRLTSGAIFLSTCKAL